MNLPSDAAREISSALEGVYPPDFLAAYDLTECLASGHGTETFLAKEKAQGRLCVVKRYDRQAYPSAPESGILGSLCHSGLPRFLGEFSNEQSICVVRQYIEGMPLDQFMMIHAPSTARILGLCAGLCDVLQYLHSREKPVIHRDIKPQNLIVKPDGSLCLIDFDIAREYNRDSRQDTRFIGTRVYAPPEQYGFSQTDCRTDIYSFGVLLCRMLTGHTDLGGADGLPPRLRAVVRRCTAFSPQDRYPSAAHVKRALLRAGAGRRGSLRTLCTVAALLIALGAGFAAGRYTSFLDPSAHQDTVSFQEPLMEQAARAQLGLGKEELLSRDTLASVREIYIFGEEVSISESPFAFGLSGERGNTPPGQIATLTDIGLFPGLRLLYVNHQILADISALAGVEGLTRVDLRHTQVSDVSALSGMRSLSNLNLYGTYVADVTCLDQCPNLRHLELGGTLISSVSRLGGYSSVITLSLKNVLLPSLVGIERFAVLQTLYLTGTRLSDLTPLLGLPSLKHVVLDESMREAAQALGPTAFEITYE